MNKTGAFFIGFGTGVVFMLVLIAAAACVLWLTSWQGVFHQASIDARESSLASNLQTVQSQLEFYKVQHLEMYPSQLRSVGTDGKKFAQQLTRKTDAAGKFTKDADYGPYLQEMPPNLFAIGDGSVKIGKTPCPDDGSSDWYFCTESNKFSPNDAKHKDR